MNCAGVLEAEEAKTQAGVTLQGDLEQLEEVETTESSVKAGETCSQTSPF